MPDKLSRRKLARYVADRVTDGTIPEEVLQELAAYLVESDRQRELVLIVRAIEDILEERCIVIATVTTAHKTDSSLAASLQTRINAKELYVREVVNPKVIGGVRLQTPSKTFDSTIAHKITLLQNAKV